MYVFICQCVMHRQADDTVCHLVGNGEILRTGTLQPTVGGELADEGIEVAAPMNTLLFHLEIELIARHAIFLGIYKNREIGIIKPHPRPLGGITERF